MRFIALLCLLTTAYAFSDEALPAPYNTLKEILPFDSGGWYANASPMEALLKSKSAKIVIELGSWKGTSTRHIAGCLPEDGRVYAVDHWFCPPYDDPNSIGCANENIYTLYQQFLSNVIHAKLTHKITPIRMTTGEALVVFMDQDIKPDLIYVDSAHDEVSVYQDIAMYFPLVKGHGVICGDDWGWGIGWGYTADHLPVQSAVIRYAEENNLLIEVHNQNFWILYEQNP